MAKALRTGYEGAHYQETDRGQDSKTIRLPPYTYLLSSLHFIVLFCYNLN